VSRRSQRVEDLLQTEIADLLLRETRDPRLREAHVAHVQVAPDLGHARILVSVLADDPERQETVKALNHAAGFFKSRLAQRLRHMRRIPVLQFQLDRGPEHSQRITDLLENLE
jgi:ribosome-binding factor A